MGCWLCRWKERENPIKDSRILPKTRWECSKRKQPPCLNDESNCYTEFHQLQNGRLDCGAWGMGGVAVEGSGFRWGICIYKAAQHVNYYFVNGNLYLLLEKAC